MVLSVTDDHQLLINVLFSGFFPGWGEGKVRVPSITLCVIFIGNEDLRYVPSFEQNPKFIPVLCILQLKSALWFNDKTNTEIIWIIESGLIIVFQKVQLLFDPKNRVTQ